jgi:late competence protein required for DNA uptake (superfamily II DNA/RNA helicase)
MSILSALATFALWLTVLALLAVALLVVYRASLKRHPYVDCRRCKGTGERRSRLFAHSFGYCPDCVGTGRKVRAGARLLNVR